MELKVWVVLFESYDSSAQIEGVFMSEEVAKASHENVEWIQDDGGFYATLDEGGMLSITAASVKTA